MLVDATQPKRPMFCQVASSKNNNKLKKKPQLFTIQSLPLEKTPEIHHKNASWQNFDVTSQSNSLSQCTISDEKSWNLRINGQVQGWRVLFYFFVDDLVAKQLKNPAKFQPKHPNTASAEYVQLSNWII